MRTTIIPAQITTVEDRIVGNLTMQQVIILAIPLFWAMLSYIILPPQNQVVWYKIIFTFFVLLICFLLSLRIKGKVVINWLSIFLTYNLRPKYFIYNKNDLYLRDGVIIKTIKHKQKAVSVKKKITTAKGHTIQDLIGLEQFVKNPNISFSLKPSKKGGLYVVFGKK